MPARSMEMAPPSARPLLVRCSGSLHGSSDAVSTTAHSQAPWLILLHNEQSMSSCHPIPLNLFVSNHYADRRK